jgi:hypothetical protein
VIGLLPFAILIMLAVIGLGVWSGLKALAAFRGRQPIPSMALVSLLSALGVTAMILRIVIALTIGLAHSRSPFEYTRLHGLACLALVFIVPSVIILTYHFHARSRK